MNTLNPKTRLARGPARRASFLTITAALLMAPCLCAQAPDPAAKDAPVPTQPAGRPLVPRGPRLYTLKFDGGRLKSLCDALRAAFPKDNVVVRESQEWTDLPGFELRNVRLEEIGRTIEFLSEGRLSVEVVESQDDTSGNIWRIGRNHSAEAAGSVKMRAVAAPNLFANEKALAEIRDAAEVMQNERQKSIMITGGAGGAFRGAQLRQLPSQGIFVIIGDEEGVAGLENLIQVAEEDQVRNVAELLREAPKMKAIAAPHLFVNEERLGRFLQEYQIMTSVHADVFDYRWETAGLKIGSSAYWAEIHPRREESIFMLVGNPDAIAGLESLIQAAEQLAAVEDAAEDARLTAEQKAVRDEARVKAKADARAKEKARLEVHWHEKQKKKDELKAAKEAEEAAKKGASDQ